MAISCDKKRATGVVYLFALEPRNNDMAARVSISQYRTAFRVRLETEAAGYVHLGFVAAHDADEMVDSYEDAQRLGEKWAAEYAGGERG
jgi:hypothetical protein